jgi:hypothetical protein
MYRKAKNYRARNSPGAQCDYGPEPETAETRATPAASDEGSPKW